MTKKSHKMLLKPEREDIGCMWGLINLFDFRQVPNTPRLLSDRKRGNGNGYSRISLDSLDSVNSKHSNDDSRSEKVDVGMSSVKTLIEEEMSEELTDKKIPNNENEDSRSETNPGKNRKLRNKKCKVTSDANIENLTAESLKDQESDNSIPNERSPINIDLAALLIELYSYNNNQETSVDSNNMVNLCTALRTISEKMHNNLGEPDSVLCQKHCILKKALVVVEEAIASHNPVDEKQFIGQKCIQSQELEDALEILNLNKELLLKLLRDPESLLLNQDRVLTGIQAKKISKLPSNNSLENIWLLEKRESSVKHEASDSKELLHKQVRYNFFWKKDKTKEIKPLREDQNPESLSRIVVLAPNPSRKENSSILVDPSCSLQLHPTSRNEDGERVFPYFSLYEIKRRLKRVFGASRKERRAISMDGMLHKIPIDRKDSVKADKGIDNETLKLQSPRISFSHDEKFSDSSVIYKDTDNKTNLDCIENDTSPITTGRSIYKEAKKHLVEMLDAGVQTDDMPTYETSKPLGDFLSLPEFSESPSCTAVKMEAESSVQLAGNAVLEHLLLEDKTNYVSPSIQSLKVSSSLVTDLVEEVNLNKEVGALIEEGSYTGEILIDEGSLVIAEADEINRGGLASNQLDAVFVTENDEPDQYKEESATVSLQAMGDDKPQNLDLSEALPRFSVTDNLLAAERKTAMSERQGSAAFRENFIKKARAQVQPRKFSLNDSGTSSKASNFFGSEAKLITLFSDDEVRSEYIEAVLGASGLSKDELSEIWLFEDQLLDPSLVDKVGISYYPVEDDRKLLFDCINEVLVEIQWRYFRFNPALSYAKPNILPAPFGKRLIDEVNKGVKGCISTQFPTIEQIIERELDNSSWMDLRLEMDDIVLDIWDTVLEDSVDETVFDLWF